ncbi:serine hydrolase domain-containing protein [uncultured Thiodictyon sp.]|uniref:serine hydrolase domain-containing protein n=1 Tax=uncultured Thiodictyon sp. TaxID=1846217 RepID=UPI0025EC179A|nr:serine hydrolase domain-containing protein [uncultured Thiodictyon sp.]
MMLLFWPASVTPTGAAQQLRQALEQVQLDGATLTLPQAMARDHVPGISIALIDDYQIAGTLADGYKQSGQSEPITPHTLIQAASLSKSVAAATAMKLVQLKRMSLDDDVDRELKSWHLSEYSPDPQRKLTLRELLNMTAGINLSGFSGYPPNQPLPTLVEILNGQPPATSAPIQAVAPPGQRYAYSGGGYEIMEQLIEDITGRRFADITKELILRPAGMRHSYFVQPLPPQLAKQAACGHLEDGQPLEGQWRVFPELAAAGLWSTPADLARFVIAMMNAYRGTSGAMLDQASATEMLTLPDNGFYGLGLVVRGTGRTLHFLKQGHNAGYQNWMIGFPNTGQGAVVMTNSDAGSPLAQAVVNALAQAFAWPPLEQLEDGMFTSPHP